MDLKIKLVDTAKEYQTILKIRKTVFIDEQKISRTIEIDSNERSSHYVIALINDIPVGTARWRHIKHEVKLERFAVLKEHRNKGIGRKLNDFILKKIPKNRIIFLNSQETAIGFYEKLGFKDEIEKNKEQLSKIKISKPFIALPNHKSSATSKMYLFQRI